MQTTSQIQILFRVSWEDFVFNKLTRANTVFKLCECAVYSSVLIPFDFKNLFTGCCSSWFVSGLKVLFGKTLIGALVSKLFFLKS